MTEVLFDSSAAGTLALAKRIPDYKIYESTIECDESGVLSEVEARRVPAPEGEPLIDGPDDVVLCFDIHADMGDISTLSDFSSRRDFWMKMYEFPPSTEDFDVDEFADEMIRSATQSYGQLMQAADAGEHIRIWSSDTPSDSCGLYWLMHELADKPCTISAIKVPLTRPMQQDGTFQTNNNLGEMLPDDLTAMVIYEKPLDETWRALYKHKWEWLAYENAPLRATLNGTVQSVPEQFYDCFIYDSLQNMDDEFVAVRLVADSFTKPLCGGDECWFRYRIIRMIEDGALTVKQRNDGGFYQWVLSKT